MILNIKTIAVFCLLLVHFTMLASSKNLPSEIDSLNQIAWDIAREKPLEAIKLSKQALQLASSINYIRGQGISYDCLGTFYTDINNYSQAEEFLNNAIKIYQTSGDKYRKAQTYDKLCRLKKEEGDYLQAIDYGTKAIETLTELEEERNISALLLNLAIVYQFNQDTSDARKYYDLALEAAIAGADTVNLLLTHYNKAFFHNELGEFEDAVFHLNKGLPIAKQKDEFLVEAAIYDVFGVIYTKKEQYAEALEMFNNSIEISKVQNSTLQLFHSYIDISSLYSKTKESNLALDFCKQAEILATSLAKIEEEEILSRRFSEIYDELGDTAKSYHFFKKAEILEDSIINKAKNESIHLLKRKHAENISTKAKAQQAIVEAKNYKLIVLFSFLSLLSLIAFVVVNQRRRAKARELVSYKKDQEKRINLRIIEGTKKTRKDLSHKLHNHVSTPLTHIKRLLEPVYKQFSFDKDIGDDIFQAIQIADNTHVISRDISYELRPEKIDWVDNIKLSLAGLKSITSDFRVDALKEEDFPREKGVKISAIICNVISNIEKHSKADNVKISITKTTDSLEITVKDNGIGFDPEKTKGVGLDSIYSDINELKGYLKIKSVKDIGTTINVKIPA